MNSAVKKRADEIFKKTYSVCYLPLTKYCNVRLGAARDAADDCVQEAFLVLYNRLLSGEDIENPRAYLYRTADNFVKRALTSYSNDLKRKVPIENANETAAEEQPFDYDSQDYDLLAEKLLNTLGDKEQELYRLKYIEHRPLTEISEILGISPVAAAKRTSRLRATIKENLTELINNQM